MSYFTDAGYTNDTVFVLSEEGLRSYPEWADCTFVLAEDDWSGCVGYKVYRNRKLLESCWYMFMSRLTPIYNSPQDEPAVAQKKVVYGVLVDDGTAGKLIYNVKLDDPESSDRPFLTTDKAEAEKLRDSMAYEFPTSTYELTEWEF